ncbi:MAG: hypothetical protein M3335_02000 [Actinomycetota bacterium]|nr:hypothetical protein [Actinomycetota bacterium]
MGAFNVLGDNRREALKLPAGFRGEEAEGEDHKDDDVKLSDENLSVLLKFVDVVRSSR